MPFARHDGEQWNFHDDETGEVIPDSAVDGISFPSDQVTVEGHDVWTITGPATAMGRIGRERVSGIPVRF